MAQPTSDQRVVGRTTAMPPKSREPRGGVAPAGEHILVVDDDPQIREVIGDYLSAEGFKVSQAGDGTAMQRVLEAGPADLVILDVQLPGEDGLTLAARLRRESQGGIIMLSRKDDLVDRVAGLEVGADDYVAKPFELRELLARVRSVLRRRRPDAAPLAATADHEAGRKLRFAGYELDPHARLLFAANGQPVELSAGEFDLLAIFLDHPKRALTRDQILQNVRGREAGTFDRSIDVQVGRLRRKIEVNPRRPELIKTVRSIGYMFDMDVQSG
jgi:DNA-binding response OmpR family regulator